MSDPQRHEPHVSLGLKYNVEKDCFELFLSTIKSVTKIYLTADDMIMIGNDMAMEGKRYKDDPLKFIEKYKNQIQERIESGFKV